MNISNRWIHGTAWRVSTRSIRRQPALSRIRVVLGGLCLSLNLISWLRRLAWLLLPVLAVQAIATAPGQGLPQAWHQAGGSFAALWCQLLSLGVVVLTTQQLRHHWSRPEHGLTTLALLPGLGAAPQVHRDLLSAAMLPPVRWLLALGVLALIASVSASRGALAALLVFACTLGNVLTLATLALYTFSGRQLPAAALATVLASLTLLSLLGFALPSWLSHGGMVAAAAGIPFFGLLWVSHYGAMAWMLLMGWANFFDRPHPFLPNP